MNRPSRLTHRWIAAAMPAAAVLAPAVAFADDSDAGIAAGASLGGRAEYFRAKEATAGSWSPGLQLRLPFSPMFALEGSIDYRKETIGTSVVDVYPVQASLLVFLMPSSRLTPYVLGGAGWYYTQVEAPYKRTQYRYGPHAGAGLKLSLNHSWSVDGSYRYLWTTDINSADAAHPGGRNYSDNGYMLTGALNYHF
jgi:opacity protein-like surface antigen